jgi:isoleucyl-tRNA synthetase
VAARNKAPFKKIITHGFVVDENKQKMSKSIGNVIAPEQIIHGGKNKSKFPGYGLDGLRFWIAMSDFTRDVVVGPTVLAVAGESVRKIRNTCRFLLGNLHQFQPSSQVIPLLGVDRFVLHQLHALETEVKSAYECHNYGKVAQSLNNFTNNTLSAVYFESLKDRLYAEALSSPSRFAAQDTLAKVPNEDLRLQIQ